MPTPATSSPTNSNYFSPTGCFCSNFIFCTTGVFQVIIVQWLDYHGLNGGSTGLTVLSSYLGLLLFAVPFTFSNRDDGTARYHPMFTVCIVSDVLSNVCNQLSISLCGSMLFMIIYSSIIVFSALLRWKVYGMGITRQQTQALIVITLGLLITAFDGADTADTTALPPMLSPSSGMPRSTYIVPRKGNANANANDNNNNNRMLLPKSYGLANTYLTKTGRVHFSPVPSPLYNTDLDGGKTGIGGTTEPEDPGQVILGMILALMGAFGYAWVYVLSEQITISKDNPLSPYAFAAYGGFYGSAMCSTYIAVFVGPHWTRDIIQPVQQSGASYFSVASLYALLLIMCGAHNLSFVFLGKNGGGAVVAGVNKAVQTISVFVISALVFGPQHPEQRMTPYKVGALVLVVVGVLMYAKAKSDDKKSGTNTKYQRIANVNNNVKHDGDLVSTTTADEFGLVDEQDNTLTEKKDHKRLKEVEMGNIRSRVESKK